MGEAGVVAALRNAVLAELVHLGLESAPVVLVDHGSPSRHVTAVRDYMGLCLETVLGYSCEGVYVASMERRPEPAYDFNEPLLECVFDQHTVLQDGDVIVALMFVSPGRHAGPEGDIASILEGVQGRYPCLRTHMTSLLGTAPQIPQVLAERILGHLAPA